MTQRLIKLAKKEKSEKYSEVKSSLKSLFAPTVIGIGAGSGLAKALIIRPALKRIYSKNQKGLSTKEIRRLAKILKTKKPIKIYRRSELAKYFGSPLYEPREHAIHLPHPKVAPEFVAHEIGHASAGKLRRALMALRPTFRLAGTVSPFIAAFADPDSKLSKYAPVLAAVSGVPILTEEAIASIKGYKALGKIQKKLPRGSKGALLAAFGTYAIPELANVLSTIAIRHAKKKIQQKHQRNTK
jgi:hypothetical protein